MKKHLKYASYIIKHKWYVLLECWKQGLIWQGIVHDMSKLHPNEWIPYANFFYGNYPKKLNGYQKCYHPFLKTKNDIRKEFNFAWLKHIHRNKHHWQYWILNKDNGGVIVLPMPEKYLKEMICDWVGAGKAQGKLSPKNDPYFETRQWWDKNKSKMIFHPLTRSMIEKYIT